MSFESLTLPAAATRWRLDGPTGPHLDLLVAGLVGAGCTVETLVAGKAYRVDGAEALLSVLAVELANAEGFTLAIEQPPADVVALSTSAAPLHAPRRAVVVHGSGTNAAAWVRSAIDRGLGVQTVGVQRWSVTGRGEALVGWLSAAWGRPVPDVMKALGVTAEELAAEDAPPAPVVNVNLPDRRIESTITRDRDGNIVDVVQKEVTLQ